ncbi:capsule polysaccharide biosynthesis [Isoalcanivorax pacificus W11-5]|uniref:Capsule polysaccharide biosynthesis n=1 Tax=Isoalcanivorax pacificus W11-5 TaxID=391936 RepID=A0A0B4XKE8_9GAMM|nr:polysaccharide synthesis/modification protein [Isoalcanivorax pacificus]AJD46877.1 capsule polysaccharide biosynthesis [Isoalcanivorax pacificus W11-5]
MAAPDTPRILFLAMSRNQAAYFTRLAGAMAVEGVILQAKHPGRAPLAPALRWLWQRRAQWASWLRFRVDKGRVNAGSGGVLFRFGLMLRAAFCLAGAMRDVRQARPDALFMLNGAHYKQRVVTAWIKEQGIQTMFLELGCLPDTMALDARGVNFDSEVPRDPAFYRAYQPSGEPVTDKLVRRPPRKPVGDPITLPAHYVFVPFQVYDDTQILIHSPWLRDMEALYDALLQSVEALPPDHVFVVKEHPTSKRDYRALHDRHPRILFANANDTQALIEHAALVITINSTVGIEALLLGRPVLTLGNAFYNIDGLVSHADNVAQLREVVSAPGQAPFDPGLVRHFVAWLHERYLVPGRIKHWNDQHPVRMRQRLDDILRGELP